MSISWESTVVSAVATNETQQFSADAVINKKVNIAVSGLQKYIQKYFINDITRDKDKELIADFMISCVKQESCKNSTKRVYAISLAYLCRYLASKKLDISLDEVSADMLYDYMTTFRPEATAEAIKTTTEKEKGDETSDEEETRLLQQQQQHQSWITTQQTQCNPLRKFYKWVAYPQLTAHQRKRLPKDKWPDVLRRFELAVKPTGSPMTPIKDSDIWEEKDIAIFLKYCTDYPRLRLFTSMAWETSGRPSELLELKIGDIEDNMQQDAKGEPCSI